MSQAGEVQGDWPKGGGDRPYVSNDADATLEILTATTNGHFVLRKRWKGADAPPPEDFRWRNGQYQGDE